MMRDSGEVDLSLLAKEKFFIEKVQKGIRCHAVRADNCNVIRYKAARKTFDQVSFVSTMN